MIASPRKLALLALAALWAAAGAGCREDRLLGPTEITELFSGVTITGYHEKKGYKFKSYYAPDGTFRSFQGGASTPRKGTWRVTKDRDICVHWEDTNEKLCRKMVTDGKGHYWKIKVKRNGKRILIVSFMSFTRGNPDGL